MSLDAFGVKAQVGNRPRSAKTSKAAVNCASVGSSLGKRDSERNATPRGSDQPAGRGEAPPGKAAREKKHRQRAAKKRDEQFSKKPLDPKFTLAGLASKRARARLFESSLTSRGPWDSSERDKMHHIAQAMSRCSCPVADKDYIVSRRGKAGMPRKWSRPVVRKCDQGACWTCAARQAASQAADVEEMMRLHIATSPENLVMMGVVTLRHLPAIWTYEQKLAFRKLLKDAFEYERKNYAQERRESLSSIAYARKFEEVQTEVVNVRVCEVETKKEISIWQYHPHANELDFIVDEKLAALDRTYRSEFKNERKKLHKLDAMHPSIRKEAKDIAFEYLKKLDFEKANLELEYAKNRHVLWKRSLAWAITQERLTDPQAFWSINLENDAEFVEPPRLVELKNPDKRGRFFVQTGGVVCELSSDPDVVPTYFAKDFASQPSKVGGNRVFSAPFQLILSNDEEHQRRFEEYVMIADKFLSFQTSRHGKTKIGALKFLREEFLKTHSEEEALKISSEIGHKKGKRYEYVANSNALELFFTQKIDDETGQEKVNLFLDQANALNPAYRLLAKADGPPAVYEKLLNTRVTKERIDKEIKESWANQKKPRRENAEERLARYRKERLEHQKIRNKSMKYSRDVFEEVVD